MRLVLRMAVVSLEHNPRLREGITVAKKGRSAAVDF